MGGGLIMGRYVTYFERIAGSAWLKPVLITARSRSKYMPHQGKRECARRLRQLEARHGR